MHTTVHIGYESESVNTNPPPPHGVVVLEKQELKQKDLVPSMPTKSDDSNHSRLRHLDNLPCTPLYIGYESESVNTNPPPPHGVVVLEKQELKQKEGARLRSSCAQQQCSRVVVEHNVQESRSFVQKYECGLWLWTGLFYAMIVQIK